jgi:hypothetical protein
MLTHFGYKKGRLTELAVNRGQGEGKSIRKILGQDCYTLLKATDCAKWGHSAFPELTQEKQNVPINPEESDDESRSEILGQARRGLFETTCLR